MTAIARHQPLTAWLASYARKRPVKAAYRRATTPQALAEHSTQERKSACTSLAVIVSFSRTPPNLDGGALRVSTTLSNPPSRRLLLVNDLDAA